MGADTIVTIVYATVIAVNTTKCAALVALVLAVGVSELHAQSEVVIDTIDIDITGRTRRWLVEDELTLAVGQRFASADELETTVRRQEQDLRNLRQFAEVTATVSIDTTETPARASIRFVVVDTLNIIALPYVKYDSNTGLLLSLRGRDYNFFGTLSTLELDLDYEQISEDRSVSAIKLSFAAPFRAFDQRWITLSSQEISWEAGDVSYTGTLGIAYDLPLGAQALRLGVEQGYTRIDDKNDAKDEQYLINTVSAQSELVVWRMNNRLRSVRYITLVRTSVRYWPEPGGPLDEGIEPGFDQKLESGTVDWIGNYRSGLAISLKNDNSYFISAARYEGDVTGSVASYAPLFVRADKRPRAGVSVRLTSFYLLGRVPPDQNDAGAFARGVVDDSINGDLGVALNTDAAITVVYLDRFAEGHLNLFADGAYVVDTTGEFDAKTSAHDYSPLRSGVGVEVIVFPLFARSLYVRLSFGTDLVHIVRGGDPLDTDKREIFIGLGHFY